MHVDVLTATARFFCLFSKPLWLAKYHFWKHFLLSVAVRLCSLTVLNTWYRNKPVYAVQYKNHLTSRWSMDTFDNTYDTKAQHIIHNILDLL